MRRVVERQWEGMRLVETADQSGCSMVKTTQPSTITKGSTCSKPHLFLKGSRQLYPILWIKVSSFICFGRHGTNVFSSISEDSLVSDSFPRNSTFLLLSCQFGKFQARRFDLFRRVVKRVEVSSLIRKMGTVDSQWLVWDENPLRLIGQSGIWSGQQEMVFG